MMKNLHFHRAKHLLYFQRKWKLSDGVVFLFRNYENVQIFAVFKIKITGGSTAYLRYRK